MQRVPIQPVQNVKEARRRNIELDRAHEMADFQVRRQEWASGQMPEQYEFRLPFIHAHTVLYALDSILKVLTALSGMDTPPGVADALHAFEAAIPGLVPVRNSAHHTEHRARGLDRNGKPLVLRPIDSNRAFGAPEGGMLVIGSLNDNKLTYTMSDGHLGEVEISAASVEAAQTAIQQVIDSLPWRGRAHTVPT